MSTDIVLKCKCSTNWKKPNCQIIWIISEFRRKNKITHFLNCKPLYACLQKENKDTIERTWRISILHAWLHSEHTH